MVTRGGVQALLKQFGGKRRSNPEEDQRILESCNVFDFPKLEFLAKEFAKQNGLKLTGSMDFCLRDLIGECEREYASGLVLSFEEGLAVLSCRLHKKRLYQPIKFGPKNEEKPYFLWRGVYNLSGRLKDEDIQLLSTVDYRKGVIKEPHSRDLPETQQIMIDVPTGQAKKIVTRYDDERYWFLCPSKK